MLYPRAMGDAYNDLPEALQAFHRVEDANHYEGRVTVTHGSALGRMIARAGGMPTRAGEMPFTFRATRDGDHEVWERDFNGHITRSRQWLHAPGIVVDQVGSSTFLMAPEVVGDKLHIPIVGTRAFKIPAPSFLMKSVSGVEGVDGEGRVTFDVYAILRGVGLIVRYRGAMARVD